MYHAMKDIKSDSKLSACVIGETQSYSDDGYIGISYEVTVYYDFATHGKAKSGFMTLGATPVMMYVVNTNVARIGTDSDVSIISSMLDRGYAVVVVDYLNDPKAKSPALEWSTQLLRAKALAGEYFTNPAVFEEGKYVDTLTVPAGYDVKLNGAYFMLDRHGVDGTLDEIVKTWNNDFRGVKASTVIKWVRPDGTRKATQQAWDGSPVVWYSDAEGTIEDNENGQYIKVGNTKAEKISDCVRRDGTPIDLNLYSHLVYPTHPKKKVPIMVLFSSSEAMGECLNRADRPHFAGFLFNGYAGMIAEYAYIPMVRSDAYGYWSGDNKGGLTGVNMIYATYTYNATQSATASLRYARYLALSNPDTYRFDVDHVGAYGISKTSWYTQLGAPVLRNNLITQADGLSDAEVAQRVNDKINSFVQMLLPVQCNGKTRYDNGDLRDVTVDGMTIRGGDVQPWTAWDGNEISSGVQANYSSCGGFMDYFCEGYAPQFFTENLSDPYNTQYGQQNIMINLTRTMNIPSLWFVVDIAHCFAYNVDQNHGVDVYKAFFAFMDYHLKGTPVSVCYTDPANGTHIRTTDGITVKFIGEVSVNEIQKATLTDDCGNVLAGTWTSAYGNTEWTFLASDMKGDSNYTLTIPESIVGSNGLAMGTTYKASFSTQPETQEEALCGTYVLNTNGSTVGLRVPSTGTKKYALRVLVKNAAANMLMAYDDATNALLGSVRIHGSGYYEIDLSEVLSSHQEGSMLTLRLKTANTSGNVTHWKKNFDMDDGGFSFACCEVTPAQQIDGATALKLVRTTHTRPGEYNVYLNMEGATTFSIDKLIKNGTPVTAEDLGRSFLIKLRVYDSISRPVRFWMNNATSRQEKRFDFDRCYYTGMTVANAWTEFAVPYTVYEMKYGIESQIKAFYAQFTPLGGFNAHPFYLEHFEVEEVFTDVCVDSISLIGKTE